MEIYLTCTSEPTHSQCVSSAASNKGLQLCNTVTLKNQPGWRHKLPCTLERQMSWWSSIKYMAPEYLAWTGNGLLPHLGDTVSPFFATGRWLTFMHWCYATPGMPFRQYLRVTIGLLFIAFVVVHVESHLANFTMEASFMPILGGGKNYFSTMPVLSRMGTERRLF